MFSYSKVMEFRLIGHKLGLRKNLQTHSGIMSTVSYYLSGWGEGQVSSQPSSYKNRVHLLQFSLLCCPTMWELDSSIWPQGEFWTELPYVSSHSGPPILGRWGEVDETGALIKKRNNNNKKEDTYSQMLKCLTKPEAKTKENEIWHKKQYWGRFRESAPM